MANDVVQTTTDDVSDDCSVKQSNTTNHVIEPSKEIRETVLKWCFKPKDDKSHAVANTHFNALKKIKSLFPEVQIFTNHGDELKTFKSTLSYQEYLRHFKLQYVKAYPQKKRKAMYIVIHRIYSPVSLSEIRNNADVSAMLKQVNARISTHQWKEEDTRISVLGFFLKIDPSSCLHTELEARVRQKIAKKTGKELTKIPELRCVFNTPFVYHEDGTRTATKAYALQVKSSDVTEMIELLIKTYKGEEGFVFHKMRHHSQQVYTNAIRKQNNFMSSLRVIPIKGVHREVMVHLKKSIMEIEGVKDVLMHKLTDKIGRWSVLTNEHHFKRITSTINCHLDNNVNDIYRNHKMAPDLAGFDLPQTAFKHQPNDDDSEGSVSSWISYATACESVFTMEEDRYDKPPTDDRPRPQAWGLPDQVQTHTFMSTPVSSIANTTQNEELLKSEQERARLSREVSELREQLKLFMASTGQQNTTPVATTLPPNMEEIIAITVKAALQAMRIEMSAESFTNEIPPVNNDETMNSFAQEDESK